MEEFLNKESLAKTDRKKKTKYSIILSILVVTTIWLLKVTAKHQTRLVIQQQKQQSLEKESQKTEELKTNISLMLQSNPLKHFTKNLQLLQISIPKEVWLETAELDKEILNFQGSAGSAEDFLSLRKSLVAHDFKIRSESAHEDGKVTKFRILRKVF